MSIVFNVKEDRLIIDFHSANGHLELPFRHDREPLCNILRPGIPPRITQETSRPVVLNDGWLFATGPDGRCFPLVPTGSEGSLGDGITVARSVPQTDSPPDDALAPGVFFEGDHRGPDYDRPSRHRSNQGYRFG